VAKGIKSFKKGMSEDDAAAPAPAPGQQDPFRREEPRALDTAAANPATQTTPTPQPTNKAS
jgi:hypothetical protein